MCDKGEGGVKNLKKVDDVIYGWPLEGKKSCEIELYFTRFLVQGKKSVKIKLK